VSDLTTLSCAVSPPHWAEHRRGVDAADTIPYDPLNVDDPDNTYLMVAPMNGAGYKWGIVRFRTADTYTDSTVVLRPLFWDETLGKYVIDNAVAALTFEDSADNIPGQTKFDVNGRIFIIGVVTNADALALDIDVAMFGYAP
jgi:hypothetical protein